MSELWKTMLFLELYFNHNPVPLHELYEKAMQNIDVVRLPRFHIFQNLFSHDKLNIS